MQKIICVIALFLTLNNSAQQPELLHSIDSISKILKKDKPDTIKVKHLNRVARDYSYLYMFDSSLRYAHKALELQTILFKKHTGETASEKKINWTLTRTKAYTYGILGGAHYDHGNYPEALKNHLIALRLYEKINYTIGISAACTNIGLIYYYQSNYVESLKNHIKALRMDSLAGDSLGMATAYNNIGIVLSDKADYSGALKNHKASLAIKLAIKNTDGIATSYNNLGTVYMELSNYVDAMKNYEASFKLNESMADVAGMAITSFNIGKTFFLQKNYKEAKNSLLKSIKFSKQTGYRQNLKDIYYLMSQVYEAESNYREAYEIHKLYIRYRDSLNNEKTREQTIQNQLTYDFEKKEAVALAEHQKEIHSQKIVAEEKSRKQNLIILAVMMGLFLVLGFAGFIFRSLNITRKQKYIIEKQKTLVEEHQKEIIDSITYAKRLQQAILPSAEELTKYLPEHFILYKPKDIVAGDFYWMHAVDDVLFMAAADSTGHGVPGAMVSVVCSNALNRAVDEFHLRDTGKILDKTRELVLETFAKSGEEIKDGMDISLVRIENFKLQTSKEEQTKIQWSGANNPLWYIQNKELIVIKPNKQPIGKTDNPLPFTTHTLKLNQGDVLYLMTDGYPDQFGGPKGKKYKYKTLGEKLISIAHLSMQQQQEKLADDFESWRGNLEQVDDVTIIGIRI